MRNRGLALCVLFLLASAAATQAFAQVDIESVPEDARPEEGQGSIWADGLGMLQFTWNPFSDTGGRDFLIVRISGDANDYARRQPNGKTYVHSIGEDAWVGAIVDGLTYIGEGVFQTSYFANCSVFDPSTGNFLCFIGPGPASMNTQGEVTRLVDGAECRISAHLAAFYLPNENAGGPGLFVGNIDQYSVDITNCELP